MKKIISLLVVCLVFSCVEKLIEKPENLVAKDEMISILYDLAILNAAKNTDASILINNNVEAMDFVFKKYKIDSLQFASSDLYYASIPIEYEAIYTEVDTRLERAQKSYEDQRKIEDSLKFVKSNIEKNLKSTEAKE
ncbi:MAG: DUF4296 domain-containing protein [Cellulophaga sp.]